MGINKGHQKLVVHNPHGDSARRGSQSALGRLKWHRRAIIPRVGCTHDHTDDSGTCGGKAVERPKCQF